MTSTNITLRYSISTFKDVILKKVKYKLPTEAIDMINTLATEVGAADYIRIPKFLHGQNNNWSMTNKGNNTKRNRYKSRRNKEILSTKTNEDWNKIRNFTATKINTPATKLLTIGNPKSPTRAMVSSITRSSVSCV